MAIEIQLRNGTKAEWLASDPILLEGEVGIELDSLYFKVGDGINKYSTLDYVRTLISQDANNRLVNDTQIATWNDKYTKAEIDSILKSNGDKLISNFSNKYLTIPNISDPGASESNSIRLYSKDVGGRSMLKWVGSYGIDNIAQPMVAFNKVAWWNPPGNSTTAPAVLGMSTYTAVGAATARNVATTNMFTRMKRLGYVSGSAAGSFVSVRQIVAQFTLGAGNGLGGFMKIMRFGISDAATVSAARMFIGMSSSTSAPTNVEPSTLTNSIGVGHGASDANLKLFYGGSTAQIPIDLGSNFPKNTLSTDVYELVLFAPSTASDILYYRVTRLNTNHVAEGSITATTSGVQLPLPTTLLNMTWCYRTNNTTASAVGLDIMSDYIETDY